MELPNGEIKTIESEEQWEQFWAWWKEIQPTVDAKPHLVYPVKVIFIGHDGIITVESPEAMAKLKKKCESDKPNDRDRRPCFEIIYPVNLELPDGTLVEVNGPEEWHQVASSWKEDHPDSDARPALVFPIEVKLRNGDIKLIESQEQLRRLKMACHDKDMDRPRDRERDRVRDRD